ncbi:MAG: signal peptidase II [Candidatus Aminicenantes bacterium]|jgi:signal peptidase II
MIRRLIFPIIIFALLGIDQLTKALIARSIPFQSSQSVIPGFFNLTHIRNRGAIFGFFSHSESRILFIFLTLVSLVALGLVIYYFFKTPSSQRFMKISLSVILAGALGNLIDRVFRGYVIDFLDFHIKNWHWPSFNVADACITIGAFLLIFILVFKRGKECIPSS